MGEERARWLSLLGELCGVRRVMVHNANGGRVLVVELATGRRDGEVFRERHLNMGCGVRSVQKARWMCGPQVSSHLDH